jgi:cell division protein FtsI (penicillin-binding protein 3)
MKKLLKRSASSAAAGGNVRSLNYSTSPLLASRTPAWRSRFLVALVGAGFLVLIGRALYVQAVGNDFFLKQGEIRYARTLDLSASRGRILDRNGVILASSVPTPSLWAIPKDLEATDSQRLRLARLLGMSTKELDAKLAASNNFVWLRRQVDEVLAKDVLALGIKGVHQVSEFKRQYPEGEAAAHVVGFTNVEDKGQEGIELAFQKDLAGQNGSRRVIKDRMGRVVEDMGESVAALDGQDIELSIDSKVQFFAYQRIRDAVAQHKAKAGSVVVLDVQTGEVLALANYPTFVPGDRRKLTGEQLRNRAMTDTFEPGSTMKPLVMAWALETGRVKPDTVLTTAPGSVVVSGIPIKDAHGHGALTAREVIQKSSNIGIVRVAMMMQPKELWELYANVGYGQKPQVDFPGTVTGRLRPYKTWRPIEQATMAYGYGLSASLLHVAHAYTAFAHDGEMIPLSLTRQDKPAPGMRVFSEGTAREIRKMLQMAAGQGGTAPQAQTIGYSVGGKSGTAHKQEGKGYATNKYRSWFVGMAPIDKPRIIVAVMVDEPSAGQYFGGAVAGPVFSEVVQQSLRQLGVAPDLEVRPQIVSRQIPAVEESF